MTLTSEKAVALLRVMAGAWLLWLALPNLDQGFIERFPDILELTALSNPFGWYRWLVHHVAMPWSDTLGIVFSVGQSLVGGALLVGFFVRATTLLGACYALIHMVAWGHMGMLQQAFSTLLLVMFIALLLGDAGRYYGVDGLVFREPQPEKKTLKMKFKDKKQKEVVEALAKQVKKQSGKRSKSKAK